MAYAPYGEVYNVLGGSTTDQIFTGDLTQLDAGVLFDTPNRELAAANQGRWLSPDLAGQGWNQYAYSTNPNSAIDPSGLTSTTNVSIWLPALDLGGGLDWAAFGLWGGFGGSAGGTDGDDSATSSGSSPSLCFCPDDITSGALAGTNGGVPNLGSTNWQLPFLNAGNGNQVVPGCGGAGIPCGVLQTFYGNFSDSSSGLTTSGSLYLDTIIDDNENPVPGQLSVAEVFTGVYGTIPSVWSTWNLPVDSLPYSPGTFVDSQASTLFPDATNLSQYNQFFQAQVGGTGPWYQLITQFRVTLTSVGPTSFVTSVPVQ
jgi:RHS repeat-associated protein